ncbi:hypothetical protein AKJ40_00125 [candidate division MSBL1 archaeon SCGC-AAA259M10]|uniref:Bifunctional NAD(P)H-hydrate repair enzyme n=1 Tax=candidate division MSBL1 archaeon SCGC-AAA259M10 TaxID=1698270 RepID=A0A133V365_9EURY|nr:hypothetical protein AKJ40_00125 [candidate division MSBL1 archaeon SCGC-AAA259M10]
MIALDRMQALEINSDWRGVSRRLLMENAGAQLAKEINERKSPSEAVIYAGTGNNGGDGFVAARHLINQDVKIVLVLLGRPRDITTTEAQANWQILSGMEGDIDFRIIRDSKDFQNFSEINSDVAIDAMLGTGIRGTPREPVASAIGSFNKLDSYKIAVDVPTGVDPETGEVHGNASECDLTITFHDSKPGLMGASEEFVGEIIVRDIGIPITAEKRAGPGDVRLAIPPRDEESHKGQNGRLLIVGGGSRYVGAPALAGLAALRAGTDLVTIALPSRIANIVNSFSPDLITMQLPEEDLIPEAIPKISDQLEDSTAVLIGPGLGLGTRTEDAVIELMETIATDYPDLPVLLDADGLKIVSERPDLLKESNSIVTPHAGEFEILSGKKLSSKKKERIATVSETAEELRTSILLKAHVDICADEEGKVILNDTGNPGMTVGGTGDVLGGIISAFLSRGVKPFQAAVAGSFVCGLAGDICSEERGYEFTASDVKDNIPNAIERARKYW